SLDAASPVPAFDLSLLLGPDGTVNVTDESGPRRGRTPSAPTLSTPLRDHSSRSSVGVVFQWLQTAWRKWREREGQLHMKEVQAGLAGSGRLPEPAGPPRKDFYDDPSSGGGGGAGS